MNATARQSTEAILGAANIADAVRAELVQRGRRKEEISLEWLPDPAVVAKIDLVVESLQAGLP